MESVRNLDYEEIFKDHFTPYSYVDIFKIKPNETIKTPKDLEKEGKLIHDILRDVKSKLFFG
jgi:hypothetical protein